MEEDLWYLKLEGLEACIRKLGEIRNLQLVGLILGVRNHFLKLFLHGFMYGD